MLYILSPFPKKYEFCAAIVPSKLEQMIKADPVVARNNSEHERPNERRQFSMVNGSSHPPVQEKVIVKVISIIQYYPIPKLYTNIISP